MKVLFLGLVLNIAVLSGCAGPGYVCPLKKQPGGCASELDVYHATLTRRADKSSIFIGSKIARDDKEYGNG